MIPAILLVLAAAVAPASAPAAHAVTQTRETQAALTPDKALMMLRDGNARFAGGRPTSRDVLAQVRTTAAGQFPYAAILGCIDSRVTPERVFDAGIGDLFVARVAGDVIDDDILGSLEYSTEEAGARVIVVLSHSSCGAVKGACDHLKMGHLTGLLSLLDPAVQAAVSTPGPHDSKNAAYVDRVARENARLSARALTQRSPILAHLVEEHRLRIVPAMYDVTTGKVAFLEP